MATSTRLPSTFWRVVAAANAAVDSGCVELHGAYAYERLCELAAYEQRRGSRSRAALLALVTPLPCFVVLLVVDAMPLVLPDAGLAAQTIGFWIRSALAGGAMTCVAIVTAVESIPTLAMPPFHVYGISFLVGLLPVLTGYVLAQLIGFPVPFALQTQTPLWLIMVAAALWRSWHETLRVNPHARVDLQRFLHTFNAFVAVIIVYTAFSCLFHLLDGTVQTLISCLLPFLKIAFKNWVNAGLHHSPDLKPIYSVFNIDIFHTMFVASAMEQTASGTALLAVLVIDAFQNGVAVAEIYGIVRSVKKTHDARFAIRRQSSDPLACRKSHGEAQLGPLAYALHLLETSDRLRCRLQGPGVLAADTTGTMHAVHDVAPGTEQSRTASVAPFDASGPERSPREAADPELATAQAVLKLLFMVEFYVLTEYVEVMVALLYGTFLRVYLYTLSYRPNRVFYTQLAVLSVDEQETKAHHVLVYASLELLSFIVFCVAVDRVMTPFSPIGQLGFVLKKH